MPRLDLGRYMSCNSRAEVNGLFRFWTELSPGLNPKRVHDDRTHFCVFPKRSKTTCRLTFYNENHAQIRFRPLYVVQLAGGGQRTIPLLDRIIARPESRAGTR